MDNRLQANAEIGCHILGTGVCRGISGGNRQGTVNCDCNADSPTQVDMNLNQDVNLELTPQPQTGAGIHILYYKYTF